MNESQYVYVDRLIVGGTADLIHQAVLRIDGERIGFVGPASELPEQVGPAAQHHFEAATALPGLVDAHTHFSLAADGRSYEDMAGDPDVRMALNGARNALVHLRAGITTARDNGARNRIVFELRDAIDGGWLEGPRLLVAGRPVTPSGGHFHWCNGAVDGAEAIAEAVRELVREGADHIKIMASGGGTIGTDPTRPCYSFEELHAAIETAHELGRLTTSHCRATSSMSRALDAGTDCIEHGEFMDEDGVLRYDADTARYLNDSGAFLGPTLQAAGWDTVLRLRHQAEVRGLTPDESETLRITVEEVDARLDQFNRLLDLGMNGRLVGSSDAGCFDFSFGHMDYSMELMVAGGMTPLQAIDASTRVGALACGVINDVGTLEVGKQADLVVVAGDPTSDIRAMADVIAVFKAGRVVPGAGVPLDVRTMRSQ